MTASLYPAVKDALITVLTPLESIVVWDGYAVTADYNNNLMIGVSDPDSYEPTGSAQQSWHGTGGVSGQTRDDNGDVWCTALAWNGGQGNVGVKAARDAVKSILTIVENQLRSDPVFSTVVVPGLLWTEFGTQSVWREAPGKNGVRCSCSFTVHFRGLI
jgi:hypothetical protein